MPYYDVEGTYKACHTTRGYATNEEDAKARAIKETEQGGDCLKVMEVEVTKDS